MAVVPRWVAVPSRTVEDAHRIARALAPEAVELRPVAATLDWATGLQPGPVSGRAGVPGRAEARAEAMLADAVALGRAGLPAGAWVVLGVVPARPVTADPGWCRSVSVTVGWLLGGGRAPVRVPRRGHAGGPITAAELYAERVGSRARLLEPEDRAAKWAEARREADLHERLAALAAR